MQIEEFYLLFRNIMRFVSPVVVIGILIWCAVSLLREKEMDAIYATLVEQGSGICFALRHLECSIGRSASCDVTLPVPTVSRVQAVLRYTKDGFVLHRISTGGDLMVNGAAIVKEKRIADGDVVSIGGMNFDFAHNDRVETGTVRRRPGSIPVMVLLTLFQAACAFLSLMAADEAARPQSAAVLAGMLLCEWSYVIYAEKKMHQVGLELEILAFLLSGIGFSVLVAAGSTGLVTQFAAYLVGLALYCFLLWFCADTDRVTRFRHPAAFLALALFAFNLIFGSTISGARNWVILGPVRFQPSELVKICYVFAGAATLDRLLTTRNLTLWLGFSAACVGALFLMGDFGTAMIFFVTFLIIAYMRSGDLRTIGIIGAAALFGGLLIIKFKPYIAGRFETWGRAFEFADGKGYQQSRALVGVASGGMVGVGQGNGRLKGVVASVTDLIFGVISEEWGFLVAAAVLLCFVLFAVYVLKKARGARSAFYAVTAAAAAGLMLFQACLHAFGATDVLPLTGVTLPFVSRGGSSIISSFGLLAFIKAIDPELYTKKRRVSGKEGML